MADNDHPPLTWHIALKTVYALTCYTVILSRARGTHSKLDNPNKRKIHTNTLFHLGFVEVISSPR